MMLGFRERAILEPTVNRQITPPEVVYYVDKFSGPSLIAATGQQPHNTNDKDEHGHTQTHDPHIDNRQHTIGRRAAAHHTTVNIHGRPATAYRPCLVLPVSSSCLPGILSLST